MRRSVKSVFDNSIDVSDGLCAVALAVKKGAGAPNHAFIIIQSMDFNGDCSFRTHNFGYTTTVGQEGSSGSMTISEGAVWGKNATCLDEEGMESFFKETIMSNFDYDCIAFSVPQNNVDTLNALVKKHIDNPPNYFISGGDSSGGKMYQNIRPTENCLSWARKVLIDAECATEEELPRSSFLYNSPKEYISEINESSAPSCCIIS